MRYPIDSSNMKFIFASARPRTKWLSPEEVAAGKAIEQDHDTEETGYPLWEVDVVAGVVGDKSRYSNDKDTVVIAASEMPDFDMFDRVELDGFAIRSSVRRAGGKNVFLSATAIRPAGAKPAARQPVGAAASNGSDS